MNETRGEWSILRLPNASMNEAYEYKDWCDMQFGPGTEWQMENGVPVFFFTDPWHLTVFRLMQGY
jgi:hypothetical protein